MLVTLFLTLFFVSLAVPIYVYVGYPLLLQALNAIMKGRPVRKGDELYPVCMIVSCYNEVDVIEKKIKNCVEIDYPKELINFVFVSDGSDDGTDEAIQRYSHEGVRLVRQEGRLGKTCGINLALQDIDDKIVVFSDANALYARDAIKKLVQNFNDPNVGYVVGAALYTDGSDNAAATSEDTYWQYEMRIKAIESKLASVVGGDGAIYAIRRELFIPLEREDINDFVNPLQIIAQGYRGVFEPDARCYEETAGDFDKEGRRKERIVNRSFRGLMKVKETMNPRKTGLFSLMVISHKLLRWLVPFFLLAFTLSAIALSVYGLFFFHVVVLFGTGLLWLGFLGSLKLSDTPPAALYYPYYFFLVNIMSAKGIIRALRGDIQVTWNSHRSPHERGPSATARDRLKKLLPLTCLSALTIYAICSVLQV